MSNTNNQKLEGAKLWLLLWISFHAFAFLMSTAKVKFFYTTDTLWNNNYNSGELPLPAENFWPFVNYKVATFYPQDYPEGTTEHDAVFSGIFAYYDLTEFAFYAGLGIILYIVRNNIKSFFNKYFD